MAAVEDILRTYRRPRVVVREHLARDRSEPRLFTLLFSALLVFFIAQWPEVARINYFHPDQKIPPLLLGRALGGAVGAPLSYALALLGVFVCRLFKGGNDGYGGRLALFWAQLAVSPLVLLQGVTKGMIGEGIQADVVSLLVFAVFLVFWIAGLRVTQFEARR